jgi:uncharacterized PurR-regulated membrane protein YhhQ (DUF165 family)
MMFQVVLYTLLIVAADVAAARWIVPLPFGLAVPAGVFFFSPIFTLRDSLHERYGWKWVTGFVFLSAGVSAAIAVASGNSLLGKVTAAGLLAYLVSENSDTLIYQLLHKHSFMRRVLASNAVSTLLDSGIFITIAFGPLWTLILGQYIVKMVLAWITGVVINERREKIGGRLDPAGAGGN